MSRNSGFNFSLDPASAKSLRQESDMVYMTPIPAAAASPSNSVDILESFSSVHTNDVLPTPPYSHNQRRYVAGEAFYNFGTLGTIRDGGAVKACSTKYFALMISGGFAAFIYNMARECVRLVLESRDESSATQLAASRLIDIAATLAFFVGFLSDCHAFFGYHRKSYLILGWVITALVQILVVALSHALDEELPSWFYLFCACLTSFGTLFPYVMCEVRVVELSQRETLEGRGTLLAYYAIAKTLGQCLGYAVTRMVLGGGFQLERVQAAYIILAISSIIPAVFAFFMLDDFRSYQGVSWKTGFNRFQKIMTQKVVRNIVIFICIFAVFGSLEVDALGYAVDAWTPVSPDASFIGHMIQFAFAIILIGVWRWKLQNVSWRLLYSLAPITGSIPLLFLTVFAAQHVVRNIGFYFSMVALTGIADGIMAISYLVPLVEIAEIGSEGTTVGIMLSFKKLLELVSHTVSDVIFDHGKWGFTREDIRQDASSAGTMVAALAGVVYGIKLLALVGLYYLPAQKLDAQQERIYGGFSRAGGIFILVGFAVCFTYVFVLNLLLASPSTACLRFVGGQGCDDD